MSIRARQATPLGFFEELYAIVVGLGLALAIEQVIDLNRSGLPVIAEHIPVFLAYLNIAFALAHGSVRYMQLAYDETALGPIGRGRVIADLVTGVGHFLWLMALSFFVTRPVAFAWVAIVLLLGRPIRDGLLMFGKRPRLDFDRIAVVIHLVTIGLLVASLVAGSILNGDAELWAVRVGVLIASLFYGLGMYVFGFRYFFPGERELV